MMTMMKKRIDYAELPDAVKEFVVTHFTGEDAVTDVKKDNDSYNVYFETHKAEFSIDGDWESVDGTYKNQSNPVPESVLALIPAKIIEYVVAEYPDTKVVEVDKEKKKNSLVGYEIQLNDSKNTELKFDREGNPSEGNKDVIEYDQLPTDAKTFLEEHFEGNKDVEIVLKDKDSYIISYPNYKVEFYTNGEWEGVDGDYKGQNNVVPASVAELLPEGIATYIAANHAGAEIVEIDKEMENNALAGYEVQLNDTGKTELNFDAEGNIVTSPEQ